MTLRLAATLALALGITALMAFLHLLGEGPFVTPEARHMRLMKDRSVAPSAVTPVTVGLFGTLPYRRPLAEYEPFERRGIVMEGYIKHMLRAADGDIHLEVSDALPGEGPPPLYATAEITPQWHRRARLWTYEHLRAAWRCGSGGDVTRWDDPPRRVRLTGWLMYDFQFETRQPDRTRPPYEQRESGWELHPVTKIEIWNDARAAFVEVPL